MKAEVEIEENEDVLAKHCVDIDIKQIFGVMLIAAFLALSERATREDYSDKGKEEDKWSCGGKFYIKKKLALTLHAKKTHRKFSYYLNNTIITVQCNACEIRNLVKTKLQQHLVTGHET